MARAEGVDFDREFAKLLDHTFDKPKLDPAATLRNWLRNGKDFGGDRSNGNGKRTGPAPVSPLEAFRPEDDDFAEVLASARQREAATNV